ncbi:MAG: DNA gyrase inhibitor YacG [Phycisphaerae bacterium]
MPKPTVGTDGGLFKCPLCKKPLPNQDVPTFPFCSERCRLVDLGNCLDGNYVVQRPLDPTDQIEDLPRSSRPRPEAGGAPDQSGSDPTSEN